MGFLGLGQNKKKEEPEAPPVNQAVLEENKRREDALKTSHTVWLKESQQSDLTDAFSGMRNEMTSIKPQESWGDDSVVCYYKALDVFDHLRNHWLSIDLNLITDAEGEEMYQILNHYLPQAVSKFRSITTIRDPHAGWTWQTFKHKGQNSLSLAEIYVQMTNQVIAIEQNIRVNKGTFPAVIDLKEVKTFRVPSTLAENDVRERIESISLLWQAAITKANSVEDTYFLEQANSVYVPDAVKMYENFKLASPKVKEKAKGMLLEQLILVEEEISKILNSVMEYNLEAMQAQVNFLRTKTNKELTEVGV